MVLSSRKKKGGSRGSAYTHKIKQIQDKEQKKFEKGLDKDTLTLQKAAVGIGPGRYGPLPKDLPKLERNDSGTPIPLYSRNFALSSTAKNLNRLFKEDKELIRELKEIAGLKDVSQRLSRSSSASSVDSLQDLNEDTRKKNGGSGRNLRMKTKRTYRKRNPTRKTKRKLKTRRKTKV